MPDIFALALVRGSPRTRANQKKWGIFKCPFRGILLRHQHPDRVPPGIELLWQQSMCARNFRDVGAGFKTRRDDPGLGLGRPAPPNRPCWNNIHTRGPLALLPSETCFECSYIISQYDTPRTRVKA